MLIWRNGAMAKMARSLAIATSSDAVRAYQVHFPCMQHGIWFSSRAKTETPRQVHHEFKSDKMRFLNESIANKQLSKAIAYFDQAGAPVDIKLRQQLANLLAKDGGRSHAMRAFDLLRSIYRCISSNPMITLTPARQLTALGL